MTPSEVSFDRGDRIAGVILGTAVGDSLGLPREGLSCRRARRLFGEGPLRHRLVFGRGMVSDDTDHACLVGQALLDAPADAERFARSLAWRLRWWLAGLPAGVGLGTARAIFKLWCGWPPHCSGVWSAGNGPLIALAAAHAVKSTTVVMPETFLQIVRHAIPAGDDELAELFVWFEEELNQGKSPADFADTLGLQFGVSGYIYHTVPAALYCWLSGWMAFWTFRMAPFRNLDARTGIASGAAIL
jgi:ADP-ribosylglycohydrolase